MESKFTLHFLFLFIFFLFNFTLAGQEVNATDCLGLSIDAEITPACSAGSNGQLNLLITHGLPPYQIRWDDGSNMVNRKVPAGNYQVKITDALGCQGTGSFSVSTYPPIQASVQVKHTSKSGKSNGSIVVNVTGGKVPYIYTWISSAPNAVSGTTPDMNQLKKLPSAKYKIVLFDAAGCYLEIETEVK